MHNLESRLEELRPFADEFEFLQDLLYLIDEGFVTLEEEGRLFPVDFDLFVPGG